MVARMEEQTTRQTVAVNFVPLTAKMCGPLDSVGERMDFANGNRNDNGSLALLLLFLLSGVWRLGMVC